jgi:hypothetical protein
MLEIATSFSDKVLFLNQNSFDEINNIDNVLTNEFVMKRSNERGD